MARFFPKTLSPAELMAEAKVWAHEIKKMNMGIARNYIELFQIEMGESQTVCDLSATINHFYLNPTQSGKDKMLKLAEQLVGEVEVLQVAEPA